MRLQRLLDVQRMNLMRCLDGLTLRFPILPLLLLLRLLAAGWME
jgi:hypothetical protein